MVAALALTLGAGFATATAPEVDSAGPPSFELIATFDAPGGNTYEIVAATPDGRTLIYTAAFDQVVGLVDISNPASPVSKGTIPVGGEPTSVAVLPNGRYALACVHGASSDSLKVIDLQTKTIVRSIPLGGQPDSIAISPNGRFAAIAIENERNEDVNDGVMPQLPGGFVTIVDLIGQPQTWTTRKVNLDGIAGRFPNDPEPEFISINNFNIAAVTLQENNHVVLIELNTGIVAANWSAGTVTHAADLTENNTVSFSETLTNARREPDAIGWTKSNLLVTANEGDYDLDLASGEYTGGRGFTVFSPSGQVVFDSGPFLEIAAAAQGLYPDNRSEDKGAEIEGIAIDKYDGQQLLFVGAERGNFVAVYAFDVEVFPWLLQILPMGTDARPEGLLTIPNRKLLVVANEGTGTNGNIKIFRMK